MKEVIKIKNPYNEADELIEQDADVYSFISEEVMQATGGYEVVRKLFVRERDQKLFEARVREKDPQKMMLLERNPNTPPKAVELERFELVKEIQHLTEGEPLEYHQIKYVLNAIQELGYKIVK